MKRLLLLVSVVLFMGNVLTAQVENLDKHVLTLDDVIDMAITQSSAIRYSQNRNVNNFWRFRNFKTRFLPKLSLNGDLPNYRHTTSPITQPDGSIEFKQVSNLSASAVLSLNQYIPQLGTNLYASTSAAGIRNLKNDNTSFSGSPFSIGFHQPLFAYNWMKWYRKTEPMIFDEAQKRFVEEIEEISLTSTRYFFNYLRVQTNYILAKSSLQNSQDNLKISATKKELGQISENDYSRIELSVLNAQKALSQASMDLKNADFNLKSYIGLDQNRDIELIIPLNITLFEIDPQLALEKAKENRKETTYYKRRLIDADRALAQAKSNTGLSATLRGSFGLSKSADEFAGIYEEPEKDRMMRVSVSIPILDWGNSASSVKLAESQRDLTIFDVNKDVEDFERGVIVQVEQFGLLKEHLKTATEADRVAGNGYKIALKKFQNGELSITDLNISLQEREKAKRDYIKTIENYWEAYYGLRERTLYDFERGNNITYGNPMLDEELQRYSYQNLGGD